MSTRLSCAIFRMSPGSLVTTVIPSCAACAMAAPRCASATETPVRLRIRPRRRPAGRAPPAGSPSGARRAPGGYHRRVVQDLRLALDGDPVDAGLVVAGVVGGQFGEPDEQV